jgi:hypothetical protein
MAESKSHGWMRWPSRNGVEKIQAPALMLAITESQMHRRPSHSLPAPRGRRGRKAHRPAWAKKNRAGITQLRANRSLMGESTGILI